MARKRQANRIFLFITILISFFTFNIANISIVNADSLQYFPLGMGTEWRYQTSDNNGNWETRRSIEEWEFIGLQFTIYFNEEHDGVWQNRMMLSKSSDSLMWWGFEDSNARYIAFNGLIYVTEPPKVGDVKGGSTSGTLTIKTEHSQTMNVNFQGIYTIEAIETVIVPAGTFQNCIKVHEQEITPDGIADFHVWYAPNVGPVKYQYPLRNNRVDVLDSYHVTDDDPFNWFLPKVPILVISCIIGVSALIVIIVIRKKTRN